MKESELVTDEDIDMTPTCSIESVQIKRAELYLQYLDKVVESTKEYRDNKRNANPNKKFRQIGTRRELKD